MPKLLAEALPDLPAGARVLDCGGWLHPLASATHVVDLMPYETRGGSLQLHPLAGEKFSKATWTQIDFLNSDLRLPFPDKYFALSNCSHTLEDLATPFPLLRELLRVSAAGHLSTPSRLVEQTAGARDRMTSRRGHPHHHWIVETEEDRPLFSHKGNSLDGSWWHATVPLRLSERLRSENPAANEWSFHWVGGFDWRILDGPPARARAVQFARHLGVTPAALAIDWLWRRLRVLKYARRQSDDQRTSGWWQDVVRLSQPFSQIPLE